MQKLHLSLSILTPNFQKWTKWQRKKQAKITPKNGQSDNPKNYHNLPLFAVPFFATLSILPLIFTKRQIGRWQKVLPTSFSKLIDIRHMYQWTFWIKNCLKYFYLTFSNDADHLISLIGTWTETLIWFYNPPEFWTTCIFNLENFFYNNTIWIILTSPLRVTGW